jgi:hypothetical protein
VGQSTPITKPPALAEDARLRADEIRDELNRIIASATFRGSLRLTSFLRYVVEAALIGNASRIKAYTVAVEALGRSENFDPQDDPIVRVEAMRLRHALANYYAGTGIDDPIVIEMPRGCYVPIFHRSTRASGCDNDVVPGLASRNQLDRASELIHRSERIVDSLKLMRKLARSQRVEIAALTSEIEIARQTLQASRRKIVQDIALAQAALPPDAGFRSNGPIARPKR